jgi:hypothetical protein
MNMMECVFHGKIKNMGLIKFTIGCVVAAVLGVICAVVSLRLVNSVLDVIEGATVPYI